MPKYQEFIKILEDQLIPHYKQVLTQLTGDYSKDIVIVERGENAKNGDIVVAMDDENQVTIKRYFKEKDYVRLQPENDYMLPIILKNATILGKAIGLYRKF